MHRLVSISEAAVIILVHFKPLLNYKISYTCRLAGSCRCANAL